MEILPAETVASNHSTNAPDIRRRLLYLVDKASGTISRSEIARRIGMDPSNLSKHLTGKLPVSRSLINRFVVEMGVSKQWLLHGEGLPFEKPVEAIEAPLVKAVDGHRGVPVYDIDVTAGCSPLERMLTSDRITGYVDLPRLNPESMIVRVSGDSMEPKIINGGFIAIRPIKSIDTIFWGQIYVIVMEEYRMVKFLRRHPNDDSLVILHSENPAYDDMDVRRSDIQALFLVESILNYRHLC